MKKPTKKAKKTASRTSSRQTKSREQLKEEIKKILIEGKTPDGKLASLCSIAKYLTSLNIDWQSDPNGQYKGRPIGYHGIKKIAQKIQSPLKDGFNKSINIDIDPLILSDEFELEEGESEAKEAYVIKGGSYVMGIINDIHIPFHDLNALRAAINYMRERKVNKILINGDLFDFHGLSRFVKNPSKQFIKEEIEIGKKFFDQLRKLFPTEEIIYKYGNHDSRLTTFIYEKATALYGLDAIQLSELLNLRDYNVKTVAPEQIIKAGKLVIIHGHEFPSGGAINVARSIRIKAGDNIAMGHFHRIQVDEIVGAGGNRNGAYAMGCLCNLRPTWYPMAYTQWKHGVAIVTVKEDGNYMFENKEIRNGVVI